MKFVFSILLLIVTFNQLWAQTVVSRKIAQRHDAYVNGNWEGQDSLIFNYATTGFEIYRLALKGNTNNSWDNSYRSSKQYDFNENLTENIRENWTNGNWSYSTKYSYTYDANNNKIQTLYQTWDANNNTWVNAGRNDYEYNSLNNETLLKGFVWQNNAWNNFTRKESTYFGDSLVKETQTFSWINNDWKKNEKKNYTYNQQYINSIDISINGDSVWIPDSRIEYFLNTNYTPPINEMTTFFDRDTTNNLWIFNNRIDYVYNVNSLEKELYQNYNVALSSWNDTKRISYLYNTNQQIATITEELNNNGWLNNTKSERQYNTQQLLALQTDYSWNNSWQNDQEISYQYNADDSLTYRLTKEYVSASFVPSLQDFFYYNKFTVGVNDLHQESLPIAIYPNPATHTLNYSLPPSHKGTFAEAIYSLEGKVVWTRTGSFNNTESIDISNLAVGQYIFRIESKEATYTASFIKR